MVFKNKMDTNRFHQRHHSRHAPLPPEYALSIKRIMKWRYMYKANIGYLLCKTHYDVNSGV